MTAMRPLPIFDPAAAWADFDATVRALPRCEHNAAWWASGPGRPMPPDCAENRAHAARVDLARAGWRLALANAQARP